MTGESVSGLLVVVDSLGTSWPWETELSSKAAAAPSLLSSSGLWHFSMSCSSSVESTALTELLISAKPTRKSLCDKKDDGPTKGLKIKDFYQTEKACLTFLSLKGISTENIKRASPSSSSEFFCSVLVSWVSLHVVPWSTEHSHRSDKEKYVEAKVVGEKISPWR